MKLDSEEQRTELLSLLSTVTYTVTSSTIAVAKAQIDALHGAIRDAGIDEDERDIVPIEDLAPTNRLAEIPENGVVVEEG